MPGIDRSRIVGMSDHDLDEFTCGICHDIFNNPVMTQCCQQTYCRLCIEEWVTTQKSCPNDRKIVRVADLTKVPRFVINLLNNMRIKCEFHEKGCSFVTTAEELSKHSDECKHKPEINCQICGLMREDNEDHNCITNLVIKNNSIVDELERLKKENEELKKRNNSMIPAISELLFSARNSIDDFEIEDSINMETSLQQILINECKFAILTKNDSGAICAYLKNKLGVCNNVFVYTKGGCAHNFIKPDKYLRIRFGELKIVMFI